MILISKLRSLQNGLDPVQRDNKILYHRLITACQGVPACDFACFKLASDLPSFINSLQSLVKTYEASHLPVAPMFMATDDNDDGEVYYTNRRFYRNDRGSSRYSRFNRNLRSQPSRFRNSRLQPKRCFVYKKEGCQSTKHTEEEQEESKKRYKAQFGRKFDEHASQYITEYKGTEEDAGFDDFEAFIIEFDKEHAKQFMVSTINTLTNHSLQHALTRALPDTPTNPFAYSTTPEKSSRYNSDKFYSIMIDTGASNASTTGFGQYLAYQNIIDSTATLNTATAGAINVQFGIGSTPLVGSLTVSTLVGAVEFHIVQANTPFLLCLANLDGLRCYYNNPQDKVVTLTTIVLVARQFGHLFILQGKSL